MLCNLLILLSTENLSLDDFGVEPRCFCPTVFPGRALDDESACETDVRSRQPDQQEIRHRHMPINPLFPTLMRHTSKNAPKLDFWMASMDFLTICIFAHKARSLEASVRAGRSLFACNRMRLIPSGDMVLLFIDSLAR
jgi:hypothetical protein